MRFPFPPRLPRARLAAGCGLALLLVAALAAGAGPLPAGAEAVVPGKTSEEIVLSVRRADVFGRAVAAAAAADLRRTPLSRTVRIVVFESEGHEGGGARRLAELGAGGGERILADLNLDLSGGERAAGPVLQSFPVRTAGGVRLAPGWLVHAVLRSGEAVGWRYAVADRRWPLLAQLVCRSATILRRSDAERFLVAGVPAVTLADRSLAALGPGRSAEAASRLARARLDRWTQGVAAAVRRLDTLAGRPLAEDRYLVVFGRVWLRRDLMWAGFLLWALLVFRGRPGRWRGGTAGEHGRQMRAYLPGFLFRLLLLLAIFLAPVFSVLLLPAAALALVPPRRPVLRWLWAVAGLLPLLAFLAALGTAVAERTASLGDGFLGGTAAAVLVPASLLAYVWTLLLGPQGESRLTGVHASGKIES